MARYLFTDVNIFDGSGRSPFAGQVLVVDQAIDALAEAGQFSSRFCRTRLAGSPS